MPETMTQWWLSSATPSVDTLRVWVAALGLLVAGGVTVKQWRSARVFELIVPVALGLLAVGRALQNAWIADDAYISFRFAANWANGLGPVWNAGERVEGYTNPLWVALAALGEWLGAPAPHLMSGLNLLVTFVFIVGVFRALRRAFPRAMPVLPVVLALSPAVREFATSGLETLPATAAITFAGLAVLLGFRWRAAGALVCLAAMLRPDHALFFAPLGLAAVATGTKRERVDAALELVGPALVFAVCWVVRWQYYGDFYPNTYYAKSGGLSYWSQGGIYVGEFLASSRAWWPLILAPLLWLVLPSGDPAERSDPARRRDAPFFIYALGGAAMFLLYVARVGGDFMEFRFALTSLPLLGLAAEVLLARKLTGALRFAAACLALLPLAQADGLIAPHAKTLHLARESSFYRVKTWFPLVLDSHEWNQATNLHAAKPPPLMLAYGCVGMVGYYNQNVPIFDTYGKTSRAVAKRPVGARGRPGHEKVATLDDLADAGVVWSLDPLPTPFANETHFNYPRGEGWALRLAPELVDWTRHLHAPLAPVTILNRLGDNEAVAAQLDALSLLFDAQPEVLERELVTRGFVAPRAFACDETRNECSVTLTCAEETLELAGAASCSLSPSGASQRIAPCDGTATFEVRCHERGHAQWLLTRAPAAFGARVQATRARGPLELSRVFGASPDANALLIARADFEDARLPDHITLSGDAIEITRGTAAGQQPVRGFTGESLINTYARGDASRGELSATFELARDRETLVAFAFGGGADCATEFAEVLADGQRVGRACGENDETLRTQAWVVPAGAAQLTVRVSDQSSRGWGHLLFDNLRVWKMP